MPYTTTTLGQALTGLSAKLYDSTNQQWTTTELTTYIVEALRTWNSLTSFWRKEFAFPLALGVWWYDLFALPNSPALLSVTDTDLIKQIEYHLLEPLTSGYPLTWTGSSQFAVSDILGALQGRRDEVLSDTSSVITRGTVNAPFQLRISLSDNVIDVRRVAWLPGAGFGYSPTALIPSDDDELDSFDAGWNLAGPLPPSSFRRSTQPPLTLDVDRIPPVPGNYEILSVNSAGSLSAAAPSLLGLPDDWIWVLKMGALSDLFSRSGLAQDPLRAEYAEKRYQEGLNLLKSAPLLLGLKLNGVSMIPDSVRNGDDFDAGWQALAAGTPGVCYLAGMNLLGFPLPDSGTAYSIVATVVQNAPVPVLVGDFIQLGPEDLDAVLDYAQHLAMLKVGGAEFESTLPLYQGFLGQASTYNKKLVTLGSFQRPIYEVSQLEVERNPVMEGQGV